MDCKEFERFIPDFVLNKLNYKELKRFLSHMDRCENCREELTIQFLVTEGMRRLEDGSAFDLQKELRQRLDEAKRHVKFHDIFMWVGIVLEIIAAGLLAGCMIWVMI